MLKKINYFIFSLLLITNSVFAKPLFIEITGGQNIGIPIAVLPFSVTRSSDPIDRAVEFENLADIIRNDLHNSGHFQALSINNIPQNPKSSTDIDPGVWKNFGAAN